MRWSGILVLSLSLVPGVILQTPQYEKAVDGDITNDRPDICRCCAGTNDNPNQMFTLNLERPYNISRIKIYGRADGSGSGDITRFGVYLSTSASIHDGVLTHTIVTTALDDFTVNRQEEYQYVIVRSDGNKFVVICEIQVYTHVCQDGYYDDCIKKCGQCKDDAACNKTTGKCPNDCKPGFQGDICSTPCDDYFYGDCKTSCGNCKGTDICDKTNGQCPNGCAAGYHQSLCKTECQDRWYGENCVEKCGNCKNSEICNKVTGACSACAPGYTGDICKSSCDWGKYGDMCLSTCGNCLNNETCNISTGFCDQGCAAGYNGTYCKTACVDGTYGRGCQSSCGNCKDGDVCDRFNGSCKEGCEAGYEGSICKTECPHTTFGENCVNICHCADNASCDRRNGTCSNGRCDFGYTGHSCSIDLNIVTKYNTTVSMSSSWDDGTALWGPELAIDNNPSTDPDNCKCCSATQPENNPYWQIDFRVQIPLMNIQIYGRTTGDHRQILNSKIYLLNDTSSDLPAPFEIITSQTTNNYYNFTIPNTLVQIVRIGRSNGILTLCEVKIYRGDCAIGRFGNGCNKECNCYDEKTCDFTNGTCQTAICKAGWIGPACNQACSFSQYGQNCSNTCHCYSNSSCDHVTGQCNSGFCASGWNGSGCNMVCTQPQYGQNCSTTCHCYMGSACDHVTGFCDNSRCASGWKGTSCSEVCDHQTFGQDCSRTCNCKDDGPCDRFTGQCNNSLCEPGWTGSSCDTKCNNKTFGENCSQTCNCVNDCHHIHGKCLVGGCVDGWEGDSCTARIVDTDKSDNIGVIAGVVSAVVVVIAVIIVVFFVVRHQRRKGTQDRLVDFCSSIASSSKPSNRGSSAARKVSTKANNVVEGEDVDEEEDDNGGGQVYINVQDLNMGVKAYELWNYIKRKLLENEKEFIDEYKSVPKMTDESTSDASLPKNRGKNRYREMHPYNCNRVHLDTTDGTGGDYINASYINGVELEKKFIASQGPQEYMVDDFWRMVWQQKAKKIVMLTNVYENSAKKIVCYWSNEEDLKYGKLTVKVLNSMDTDDYTIRDIMLTYENGGTHTVTQYHYKVWPDKDVPSTAWSLVNFWRKVNETPLPKQAGPIIVHCSAGVGRTGTYIALDCLYNEAMMSGVIKPLQTLQTLREQRVYMIQTKTQYVYLHEAIAEALYFGTHHVLQTQFEDVYQFMMGSDEKSKKSRLELQFELITKSLDLPFPEEVDNQYGNVASVQSEINAYRPRSKNRNSKNIQELDAIYLPTYNNGKGFIICKSPSEKLIAGFWGLIDEENIKSIVMISDKTTKGKVPANLGASSSALEGRYVVTCKSENNTGWFVERTYTLKEANTRSSSESSVHLIECIGWKDGQMVPGDIPSMMTMLETVIQWHPHPSEAQPILVCCGNGVAKSGLLCVLMNEMYRMRKNNGQINIVESLKKMKHRQPNIISGFPQYKYCYDVIQEVCRQDLDATQVNDTSSENEQLYQNL